jgi:hypothetical protein
MHRTSASTHEKVEMSLKVKYIRKLKQGTVWRYFSFSICTQTKKDQENFNPFHCLGGEENTDFLKFISMTPSYFQNVLGTNSINAVCVPVWSKT